MENFKSEKIEKIVGAVIEVMKEVKGMEKNSRIGTGRAAYDGTKDIDVKEIFNEEMAKQGLCILPIDIQEQTQIDRWQQEDFYNGQSNGIKTKQSVFTKVNSRYLLSHTSGQWIILAGYGHGIDPQDKGAGKASTYALKNLLLYSFLTPVGKIDDSDTKHSNDIQTPATQTGNQPKNKVDTKKTTPLPELIKDSKEWKTLMGYFEDGKVTKIEQITKKFKVSNELSVELTGLIDDSVNGKLLEDTVKKENSLEKPPAENKEKVAETKPDVEKKKEVNSTRRLPALTNEKFEETKKLGKVAILKVLAEFRMAKNQREELEEIVNGK